MFWILLAGVLVAVIWYSYRKKSTYWTDRGVKQTNPWPIFGDRWDSILTKATYIDMMQRIYYMFPNTRYTGLFDYSVPVLLLKDPELIKQITVKDFENFTDHQEIIDTKIDKLMGGMLFFLPGQKWREMRATLSGAFTSSKMKNMFHLMDEAAENFVNFFSNKNEDVIEVEMKDTFSRFTNDVIATAAFGIKCDSLEQPDNDFYLTGKEVTDFSSPMKVVKLTLYAMLPGLFKLLKLELFKKQTTNFFKSIISETIKIREEKGIVRPDMIHLLLEARKGVKINEEQEATETGFATVTESTYNGKVRKIENLTDELITSQALIFLLAGFDTVSTAMSFGSYELASNKYIQDRLRDEIKTAYKQNNEKVTYDMLMNLKYMDMVISEVLRMWPPAISMDRVCTKPYTIAPINPGENPVHLQKGDLVLLPYYAIHRDPRYYSKPNKFEPERFSDENKKYITPYTYMPFGVGPRNCIGSRFALLEIKALFFRLLLNFEIVPSKKTQIPLKLSKQEDLASAKGIWFELKRIKN